MRYILQYEIEDRREEFPISAPEINIGRGPDNQIILTDYGISRRHCRIVWDGEYCRVVDLGSRNGTKVNGERITDVKLKSGDEITLGRFPLSVVTDEGGEEAGFVIEEKPLVEAPGTIIKPMTSLLDEQFRSVTDSHELAVVAEQGQPTEEKKGNILLTLTQVARTLISADSLDEILHKVMDLTFEHLPVERGFLMLYDEEEKKLKPRLVKQREGDSKEAISISKTITEKVFNEQVGILTSDASVDPRFSAAESIIFHGIRSAMCVPLWNAGEVVGVVGVDSLMANNRFDAADLDLLTALANYSAVAIQRARLHERVRQESAVRAKLERYHSPGVVSRIMTSVAVDSDWNIEAQEREVSVLFCDIVGFTPIAEKLNPKEVAQLLNHYFGEMTTIVFEYEGTLDKFIGDAMMVVFGAPIDQKDHAKRAVAAALAMSDKVKELNSAEDIDLDVDVQVRIGVNSGTVVAGDIGSPQRMEYTVIGDTVNIASRLEDDIADPGDIVIGEATWKSIKKCKEFEFEEIGSIAIRGRESEMRCFKVNARE
ncbi:MAG TPA: adenylate/guanylate cyclase domain-containing protein [Acidobacteriota bacterium]|nr:adenylate/guanylate cyclase domain-containing protein [Acidobacteriota bacterium]